MQPISFDVLAEKYLKSGEKDEQTIFARVAKSLALVGSREKILGEFQCRCHWRRSHYELSWNWD
jgi:hypothetical protein